MQTAFVEMARRAMISISRWSSNANGDVCRGNCSVPPDAKVVAHCQCDGQLRRAGRHRRSILSEDTVRLSHFFEREKLLVLQYFRERHRRFCDPTPTPGSQKPSSFSAMADILRRLSAKSAKVEHRGGAYSSWFSLCPPCALWFNFFLLR